LSQLNDDLPLTECDKEPIHRPNGIQPCGWWLMIDPATYAVTAWAGDGLQLQPGQPLVEVWPALLPSVERYASTLKRSPEKMALAHYEHVTDQACDYDLRLHRQGEHLVVEVSLQTDLWCDDLSLMQSVCELFDQVDPGEADLHDRLCAFVEKLTGYDRVMLYRFGENGHGEVIGEAKKERLYSYRAHHFPASDIPRQARALYVTNTARFIHDTDDTPVPLSGQHDVNMSGSALRAVSPVHIEYLKNMGVQASMSVSIVVDGQLWGLIACYHQTPKKVSLGNLRCLNQLSLLVSREYSHLASVDYYRDKDQLLFGLERLLANARQWLNQSNKGASHTQLFRYLANLFDCDNVVVMDGQNHYQAWPLPDGVLEKLNQFLQEDRIFSTRHLGTFSLDWEAWRESVSGALGVRLDEDGDQQLWLLRREEARTLVWAGKPAKDATAGRISPRESFDAWQDLQQGHSRPWSRAQLDVVSVELRHRLNQWFVPGERNSAFSLLNDTSTCMIVTDANQVDNPIVFVNKAFTELFEYQPEEAKGRNPRFLNQGKLDHETAQRFHQSINQRQPFPIMAKNFTKSGRTVWVMVSISPHYDHQGRLEYLISSQYDLTQFMENRSEMSSALTQSILDTQDNLVGVMEGSKPAYLNRSFLSFFGLKSLENFQQRVGCLSELFVEDERCFYPQNDSGQPVLWLSQLLALPEPQRVVCMLSKTFEPHLFNVGIADFGPDRYIVNFTDITATMQEQQNLHHLAMTDQLTGTRNRTFFDEKVAERLNDIQQSGQVAGVSIIDIDWFKDINDVHGHLIGDDVLKSLADTIASQVRQEDWLIRWGGEEFVLLTGLKQAQALEKVLQGIAQKTASTVFGAKHVNLTVSIGGTCIQSGESVHQALERADKALYQSKEQGRNRVTVV
jgi:diguanylate cyclase (GGDEF)-like protein/PAS domain S-box-containing protein